MTARRIHRWCLVIAFSAVAAPAHADDVAVVGDADAERGLHAEIAGGMGLGTRSFVRPTLDGIQRLGTSPFPAADVGVRVEGWRAEAFALAAFIRYRTSIGFQVEERPLFALPNEVGVRAQAVELGVVPRWRLGTGHRALALAFPVGFMMRMFQAEVHGLTTPSYNLAGPHLRVELVAPIGDLVTVRVGPELHGLFFVGRALRNEGVDALGFAFGGEASVRVTLGGGFAAALHYRESHALVGHDDARDFEDVERFVTARLVGAL